VIRDYCDALDVEIDGLPLACLYGGALEGGAPVMPHLGGPVMSHLYPPAASPTRIKE
jgi:hypothetical protein